MKKAQKWIYYVNIDKNNIQSQSPVKNDYSFVHRDKFNQTIYMS